MPKQKTIYNDLEMMKAFAIHNAKQHNCNYNIVILNPDDNGNFDDYLGSTYEFVTDSFFEKHRPNVKLLYKTDDLIEEKEEADLIESANEIDILHDQGHKCFTCGKDVTHWKVDENKRVVCFTPCTNPQDNTNDKRYTEPFEDDGAYAD